MRLHRRQVGLKRFGDYTHLMTSPEPIDTDLVVPFPLEDAQSQLRPPESLFPILGRISA